jgi:formylglycine-generating enzyme required for sulfatase activity
LKKQWSVLRFLLKVGCSPLPPYLCYRVTEAQNRLPTEVEWEYAASGGRFSKNYTYSGSDDIDEVAWYWKNSGDTILTSSWNWSMLQENDNMPHPSGQKKPNALGIYEYFANI